MVMAVSGMPSANSVGSRVAVSSEATQAGAVPGRYLDVVLLRDSYSAGNGARDKDGHRSYVGPDGCFRSLDNWASKYVRHLRSQGSHVSFVNHACSGATMADIVVPNQVKGRQVIMRPPPAGVDETGEVVPWARANNACDTGSYVDEVSFEPSEPAAYTHDYVTPIPTSSKPAAATTTSTPGQAHQVSPTRSSSPPGQTVTTSSTGEPREAPSTTDRTPTGSTCWTIGPASSPSTMSPGVRAWATRRC